MWHLRKIFIKWCHNHVVCSLTFYCFLQNVNKKLPNEEVSEMSAQIVTYYIKALFHNKIKYFLFTHVWWRQNECTVIPRFLLCPDCHKIVTVIKGKGKTIAGVTSQLYHRNYIIALIASQFYHRSLMAF